MLPCRSSNFLFYLQPPSPTPQMPSLLLRISGLQQKGQLVSGGRWGSGGGGGGSEEVNSPRGYRPMSCFICKAQCWLSLLTASHVHTVDMTTAGGCALQRQLREYFYLAECDSCIRSAPEFDFLSRGSACEEKCLPC